MALNFPNQSRSYDRTRNYIRFWGYDSALEIPFFLDVSVLYRLQPKTPSDEAGFLDAFDAGRDRIHEVARQAYGRRHQTSYLLVASDF